jgi:hypothetical protein
MSDTHIIIEASPSILVVCGESSQLIVETLEGKQGIQGIQGIQGELELAVTIAATVSGVLHPFIAGENLTFGDQIYIATDGLAWKADANVSGKFPADGMAATTITAGTSGDILFLGLARLDTWTWTTGSLLYLSPSSGGITHTQPSATDDCIQVLGKALSPTVIKYNPSPDYLTHT